METWACPAEESLQHCCLDLLQRAKDSMVVELRDAAERQGSRCRGLALVGHIVREVSVRSALASVVQPLWEGNRPRKSVRREPVLVYRHVPQDLVNSLP